MEIGPIVKSMRHHRGAFSLLVLEVAFGFVILVHLVVSTQFYLGLALAGTGLADEELVVVQRRFLHPHELEEARRWARADLAALGKLDDVRAVGLFAEPPLPDNVMLPVPMRAADAAGQAAIGWGVQATPGPAAVLGLTMLAGRDLARLSEPSQDVPALISRALAIRLFGAGTGEASAIGRAIETVGWGRLRVTGVVSDFRYHGGWIPHGESAFIVAAEPVSELGLTYTLRTTPRGRQAVVERVNALLAGADDSTVSVQPLDRHKARFSRISSGAAIFLSWTAFLVVAVTVAGALALSSFSVIERTRQIGVRRALGARRREIVRYFLVENLVLTVLGLGLGMGLAILLNVFVRQLMADLVLTPGAIVFSMAIFLVTGLLSAMVPARRAAAVPPWAATRTL